MDTSHKHRVLVVTVTLKDGTVITDILFQVDVIERWLDLTGHPHPIDFDSCASVVDALGNDLLKQWATDYKGASMKSEQTAYSQWVGLKEAMEEAAKNRRWVEFEQLLEIGKSIALLGMVANLREAIKVKILPDAKIDNPPPEPVQAEKKP